VAVQMHGLLPDRSPAALLVLDMISDYQFPDGAKVRRAAARIALRNLELIVPQDCVAGPSARDSRFALGYFKEVLHARITSSQQLRLAPLNRAR